MLRHASNAREERSLSCDITARASAELADMGAARPPESTEKNPLTPTDILFPQVEGFSLPTVLDYHETKAITNGASRELEHFNYS
jgi:hypothetical protein